MARAPGSCSAPLPPSERAAPPHGGCAFVCDRIHSTVMTNNVTTTFDAHASGYDAVRRRLVPPFDAFYGTAVGALELVNGPVARVLDLGAGTGLLATRVLAAHPAAELVLLDGAPAM